MPRHKSESATINDVARAASVSPSTASRVLNNPDYDVSEALRSRVLLVAEQLSYHKAGRPRESGIRGRIGVILPNVINPMYAQALTGIETIARDYDCGVTVCLSLRDRDREHDYLNELFHRKILSVILSPVSGHVDGLKEFIRRGMRVVLLDQRLPGLECDHIEYDLIGGVHLAMRHLIERGHTRIGLATLPVTRWNREQVSQGFREALAQNGLPGDEADILIAGRESSACGPDGDFSAGFDVGERLAVELNGLTGIIVLNGTMACGLLSALRRHAVHVPDRLSVISLEDVPGAELFDPPLSALQLPAFAVGQMAATMLVSKLGVENPTFQSRSIRSHLILRGSTRAIFTPDALPIDANALQC